MSEFAIRTEDLSRTYRRKRRRGWFRQKPDDTLAEFTALDRVNLEVRQHPQGVAEREDRGAVGDVAALRARVVQ